jgi:dienelactone hydrolase
MMKELTLLFIILHCSVPPRIAAEPLPPAEMKPGLSLVAQDTLDTKAEPNAAVAECLEGLCWKPTGFNVRCVAKADQADWLMKFPSPLPSGDAVNDDVAMEWYVARDENKQPIKAPAVVVIHESGRGMVAGKIVCNGLRNNRFHAFLVHLPGYGERTSEFTADNKAMLPGLRQAIGDVRRARDAAAALPNVDANSISLQGTSLGGFVAATAAGLDHGFDRVFILLAGGGLAQVILTGERDAAGIRKRLFAVGLTENDIRAQTKTVEPLRLASRINPQRTWLFSGRDDEVVPPSCSTDWAKAANLPEGHHEIMPVGHYTAAFLFPSVLSQIVNLMRDRPRMENLPPIPNIPPPPKAPVK